MSLFSPRVWAVGGGCYGFWRLFTLYFNHFCKRKKTHPVKALPLPAYVRMYEEDDNDEENDNEENDNEENDNDEDAEEDAEEDTFVRITRHWGVGGAKTGW